MNPVSSVEPATARFRPSPVHADLRSPAYCHWVKFLAESEKWSSDRIAEYQLAEFRRIFRLAYENTVAYRELFQRAGLAPESIRTFDDIRRVPPVAKETIRGRLEDFSAPLRGRQYVTTGGSTGIPFGFYRDRLAFARELASKAHQYYRIGWREGDRQMVFRGLPVSTSSHMRFYPKFNELRCSSYHLVPEIAERYRLRAWDYRPDWIRCYPSSGYLLASFLKEAGRQFPPVKGVLCASENLYGFQKDLLASVFQARVFSHYGHYELAALAGFCEREDTYHVLPQYGYVELLRPDATPVTQPGEQGEIVATSFLMRTTPFIRYRTQDIAVLKGWECAACGRPYQVWERVDGRLQEFIVTATGRYISMTAINMHDDTFDHILQFQFLQREKGKITFRYIPKPSCNSAVLNDVRRRLLVKFGDDVRLDFEATGSIPLTSRGKHRFLIQELPAEIGDIHDRL